MPAFFGFGVVWHEDAPYVRRARRILDPWDRNPLLERLEANRVHHLAQVHQTSTELGPSASAAPQEALLRRLLDSSAFAVAERLSQLRVRAGVATEHSVVSKDEIRRALDGD